jgi:hypothetical protein
MSRETRHHNTRDAIEHTQANGDFTLEAQSREESTQREVAFNIFAAFLAPLRLCVKF